MSFEHIVLNTLKGAQIHLNVVIFYFLKGMKSRSLYVKISKDRFATIELSEPPGDWFRDSHLQEILVAFADSFYEIYNMTDPRIYKTPRCTFSILSCNKTFRSYIFKPVDKHSLEPLSSIPKTFFIRVLGRSDVADSLVAQAEVDSALRIIRNVNE